MTTYQTLLQGATVGVDSGNALDQLPDWMDMEKFHRGRSFFRRHIAAVTFALHSSVLLQFAFDGLLRSLQFSHSTDSPLKAMRRYLKTFAHVTLWHLTDVWDYTTPSLGNKSVAVIRKAHIRVARAMDKRFSDTNVRYVTLYKVESSSGGVMRVQHITQYDMAVVHSGFFTAILLYPSQFGVSCARSELDDYAFFWRVLGYLFGVDDQYNICSRGLDSTLAACKEIEAEVMSKALQNPPQGWKEMADAYISGVNLFLLGGAPLYSTESMVAFRVWMMGYDLPEWLRLTWLDRGRVWMLKVTTLLMLWCPGFEKMMNLFAFALYKHSLSYVNRQLNSYTGQDFRSRVD